MNHNKTLFPSLHPLVRLTNFAGKALSIFPWKSEYFSPEHIMKRAEIATGLSDWGEDKKFEEALQLLTSPKCDRMRLTAAGKIFLDTFLFDRLTSRLRIQHQLSRVPTIIQENIRKPIIIVGLPRSGTSLLQNLLSQDPNCHPMLHWFTSSPAPSPTPDTIKSDPRIREIEKKIWLSYKIAKEMETIHHSSARTVEECLPLIMNSFMTDVYNMFTDFIGYDDWLSGQNMRNAYNYYKIQLQILQYKFSSQKHWVLKSPAHLAHLDVLTKVLPGVSIIHTHRNPLEAIPSLLSLRMTVLGIFNEVYPHAISSIVEQSISSFRRLVELGIGFRCKSRNTDTVYDVHYNKLLNSPVEEVRKIYLHFGYRWSKGFAQKMRQWLNKNPQGKHGPHKYSLEKFNLKKEMIIQPFNDYSKFYDIEME